MRRRSCINLSNGLTPVETLMLAAVQGNGTVSGNLLAGTLTVRAGAQGISQLGASAGQTLLIGTAIDSAAVPSPYSVAMLFDLTYTIPALSFLGDFLTFQGAHQNFFNANGYNPWSIGNGLQDSGFTLDDFVATHKVPEPGSLGLMFAGLVGLAVIGAIKRWRGGRLTGFRSS